MRKILLSFIIILIIVSCQNKKEYPNLIDEREEHFRDYLTDELSLYSTYRDITTKNSSLSQSDSSQKKDYPWDFSITKDKANTILEQIAESITAKANICTLYRKEPSLQVTFPSIANVYTNEQLAEYREKGFVTNQKSILDYIKTNIISGDLTNEKGEKLNLSNTRIFLRRIGVLEGNRDKVLFGITFQMSLGNYEFTKLKGYVELEIEIPITFNKIEITKNDKGKTFEICGQKATILEFDANVLHTEINASKKSFNIICDNNGRLISSSLPKEVYNQFRYHQGLDYKAFENKFKDILSTDYQNSSIIEVTRNRVHQFDKIFFYCINESVKKTIRIPVDIEVK